MTGGAEIASDLVLLGHLCKKDFHTFTFQPLVVPVSSPMSLRLLTPSATLMTGSGQYVGDGDTIIREDPTGQRYLIVSIHLTLSEVPDQRLLSLDQ